MPADAQQLAAIQLYSIARNHQLDLTGLLIVSPGYFAQYLEGDSASLATSMSSIRRDWRHTDLVEWDPMQLEQRRFPSWRMAFFGPDEETTRAISPILVHLNGRLPDGQKVEMVRLMHALAAARAR